MRTLLAREIATNLKDDQCSILTMHKTFKNDFLESPFLKHLDEIYGGALTIVYDSEMGDGEILWSHTTQSFCIGHMTTKQKSPRVSILTTFILVCLMCENGQILIISSISSSLCSQHCPTIKCKANRLWFKVNISKCQYKHTCEFP